MQNANIVPSYPAPLMRVYISKDAEFRGMKGRRRRKRGKEEEDERVSIYPTKPLCCSRRFHKD
jgi:hypothetical protein